MGIGAGIVLIAIGAILTFAVDATVDGVSLDVTGWILMAVGALGLVWALTAASTARRNDRVTGRRVADDRRLDRRV